MKRDAAAELAGKVALVTGGSRGIGRAIAQAFLERGASVVITGRKRESLASAQDELHGLGLRQIRTIEAHSADPEAMARVFDEAESEFGTVQVLVNNAATNPVMTPLAETDLTVVDKILATNVRGYLLAAQTAAGRLREHGKSGSIINVSSVASRRGWPGLGAYSVSKAAVNMMTEVLAAELGPAGIRVNGIAPGLVKTRFSQALWGDAAAAEGVTQRLPLRRLGEPTDIVGAAVFLASDASAYITGQTLAVDGGMLVV